VPLLPRDNSVIYSVFLILVLIRNASYIFFKIAETSDDAVVLTVCTEVIYFLIESERLPRLH